MRDIGARVGIGTVEILRAGGYHTSRGAWVSIATSVQAAIDGTVEYPPSATIKVPVVSGHRSQVTVENDTVLTVGRRLAAEGPVVALNFASSSHPGGGFRNGVLAQEESLARASGLFACLERQPMYAFHRTCADMLHAGYVIYSPRVPVFRTDEGQLLDEPWPLSILTSPAVNAGAVARHAPGRLADIPGVMQERARRVLAVALRHGHSRLILGAWGCGVFGIDAEVMAEIFSDLLATEFTGAFEAVAFAIVDVADRRRLLAPFRRAAARLTERDPMTERPTATRPWECS
ncbi:MAG TPA: TIGR02452 family protein [Vicinamibacterales bacterium]|nr:TIGR02452 family protein [Vicinamibacterales bacterium]